MTLTTLALATTEAPDQYEVTPGLLGFVVTLVVAIAFLVLIRSFVKTMRTANLNERRRREQAAAAVSGGQVKQAGATQESGDAAPTGGTSSEGPEGDPSITEVRRPE